MTAMVSVATRRRFRADGDGYVTDARGAELLEIPLLNKGLAFTREERAAAEGLARVELTDVVQQVQDAMWQPEYPPIKAR